MIERTYTLELVVPISALNEEQAEESLQNIIQRLEENYAASVTVTNTESFVMEHDE